MEIKKNGVKVSRILQSLAILIFSRKLQENTYFPEYSGINMIIYYLVFFFLSQERAIDY